LIDGHRPLHEVLPGGVLEFQAAQREFTIYLLVENADTLTSNFLVDQRQQRRALPSEVDLVIDGVARLVADRLSQSGGLDAIGWIDFGEHAARFLRLLTGLLAFLATLLQLFVRQAIDTGGLG